MNADGSAHTASGSRLWLLREACRSVPIGISGRSRDLRCADIASRRTDERRIRDLKGRKRPNCASRDPCALDREPTCAQRYWDLPRTTTHARLTSAAELHCVFALEDGSLGCLRLKKWGYLIGALRRMKRSRNAPRSTQRNILPRWVPLLCARGASEAQTDPFDFSATLTYLQVRRVAHRNSYRY